MPTPYEGETPRPNPRTERPPPPPLGAHPTDEDSIAPGHPEMRRTTEPDDLAHSSNVQVYDRPATGVRSPLTKVLIGLALGLVIVGVLAAWALL